VPTTKHDGVPLYYETEGAGETVAFVGDAGYGAWQWGWQQPAVAGPYEALVFDHRGTGRSESPSGPYDVPTLAGDLGVVLGDVEAGRPHLVGAGLGGMVALAYARENRVRTLTLLGTAAHGDGLDPLAARDIEAVLSTGFRETHPDVVAGIAEWRSDDDADDDGWRAQAAAVEAFDARDWLHEVTTPALVVHGTADAVWPPERGEALAENLPRGRFEPLSGAGHLVHVERSRVVNDLLTGFLGRDERVSD